jgi:aspartate/methionine/tyrosine aminotransferase
MMAESGLAAGMARLGTESAFEVLARAKAIEETGRSVINLGIGQPDFPTPGHIVEAACQALRDGHHGYTPANGIKPLREAVVADLHRRHGVDVDPGHVLCVPGGKVTMFFAILMFGEAGAEIIYPDPGFPIYESVIRFAGAVPVPLPLVEERGFAFAASDLADRLGPRTRLVILNSPGNPTGGVIDRALNAQLAEVLRQHDCYVLADEVYSEILYEGEHDSLSAYEGLEERVILLESASKTFSMTGWRLGYAALPEALVEPITRLLINSVSCTAPAVQLAGVAALTGPRTEVEAMMAEFDRRRSAVVDGLNALPGVSCVMPQGAFYAFPNITGTGMDARAVADRLLAEAGVAVLAGTAFGAYGEGYLRLSYANSLENIAEALAAMGELLGAVAA